MNTTTTRTRVVIATRHEGHGCSDYWLTRVDLAFAEADPDGTDIMLWNVVASVGPMLAGDFTRVTVWHGDKLIGSYRGKPQREGGGVRQLADHVAYRYAKGFDFASYRD